MAGDSKKLQDPEKCSPQRDHRGISERFGRFRSGAAGLFGAKYGLKMTLGGWVTSKVDVTFLGIMLQTLGL